MRARTACVRTTILLLLGSVSHAGDEPVRKAIAYLEKNVTKLPDADGTPRKPFVYATTGLVYLMDPVTRTGENRIRPLKEYLARWTDDLEKRLEDPVNLPARHGLFQSSRVIQYTWPVAQTLWFFGELHERGLYRADMKKRIPRLIAILEAAQQENGGWGHGRVSGRKEESPFKGMGMAGGYPDTLVAASNCAAIALGSVRGIAESKSIPGARKYYLAAQLDNGAFPYDPSQRSAGPAKTNPSRTAGAVYAMHCLGMKRDRAMEKSIDYVSGEFEFLPEGHGSSTLNLFHGALLCHALGHKEWARLKESFFGRIVEKQGEDGRLECICEGKAFGATNDSRDPFGGRAGGFFMNAQHAYTTSLHAFVLLLDKGKLKLHQPMKRRRVTTGGR